MVRTKSYSVLPGFGLTMGYTLTYLGLIVLIPLAALLLRATSMSLEQFWEAAFNPRVLASYRITFGTSLVAALINSFFGFIVAWCLVRYQFPGRRFLDALIDLPFAIPTAVSGIALTAIYDKHGLIGQSLYHMGIKSAMSPLGICIALIFISLPFVVRTLQPALEEMDGESEEAAMCLGASRWETFRRVIFPTLLPSLLTGFALAFARSLGEYGSVVFISGNLPMKTEITSLLIITKFEQHDHLGATAIAIVMLVASFAILMSINGLQWYIAKKYRG
jgi:sulfate transport system permease protein